MSGRTFGITTFQRAAAGWLSVAAAFGQEPPAAGPTPGYSALEHMAPGAVAREFAAETHAWAEWRRQAAIARQRGLMDWLGYWRNGPFGISPFGPAPQPTGHEIVPNGRGGYVYRPLYPATPYPEAPPLPWDVPNWQTPPADRGQVLRESQPPVQRRSPSPRPAPEGVVPEEVPPRRRGPVEL